MTHTFAFLTQELLLCHESIFLLCHESIFLFDKYSNRDYIHKNRGDSMQRFTFDDEDDSIKETKRENSIQQEEKEPEVKKVVKTKVKHKRSHSLPKRTKTKVKYKEKSHPVMTFIKTFVLLVLVALAFGIRFYMDNPETVKQWFWEGYRYLFR